MWILLGVATADDTRSAGTQLEVRLAGVFTVVRDGITIDGVRLGSLKARQLLKLLAVERSSVVPTSRVIEVLWAEGPPSHAADNVATLVSRLRKEFGGGIVVGGREGYRLGRPPEVVVDLDTTADLVEEAERRLAAGEPGLAVAVATRAQDALAGDVALADEPDADWAEPARRELAALVRRLRHALAGGALAVGTFRQARTVAEAASAADPYDETASRLLMRAYQGLGEPGRALAVYAALQKLLSDELGANPAAETQELHLAVLREDATAAAETRGGVVGAESVRLVGRGVELRRLREMWNAAAAGSPSLVLLVGEAGIGKTCLADELARIAAATGGTVVQVRCYEAERSLFMQPVVEAVAAATRVLAPGIVRAAAGQASSVLAGLVPDAAVVFDLASGGDPGAVNVERRRVFETLTVFLRRLSTRSPMLLSLDDLHNAGRSTVEFLHYLARHAGDARLLVIGTARVEHGRDVVDPLAAVAARIDVGLLPADAVRQLAVAAGHGELAEVIMIRTRGHPLFVVESLRSLSSGEASIPSSLQEAVLTRVASLGRPVEVFLRAAAVLGSSFDLATAAGVLGEPLPVVVGYGQDALAARLLVVAGRDYEFSNDVVRDVLYATTPAPTRLAYHRRATDLLTGNPEALAAHATAAEDWPRAARAWLVAGEQALRRRATRDGEELFGRSVAAAERAGDVEVRGRALVGRARTREVRGAFDEALVDLDEAVRAAQEAGDRRLEVVALRALGGDPIVALGRPLEQATTWLRRGMQLAISLGDRGMEADLLARLAVIATNRLRFDEAVDLGRRAVAAARASGEEEALAAALDGCKTSLAYLGEVAELRAVLDELEPLLRRRGDHFRLHWTLFEGGFIAAAAGDWAQAAAQFEQALDANRRSGIAAYTGWHTAHLGWLARLQGHYDQAVSYGREAVALCAETPHPWCAATSAALLGTTLLEVGAQSEAIEMLQHGRYLAERQGPEAYLLRCLGPLAQATGSADVLMEADRMLAAVSAPPGSAWLYGSDAYLAVARAWLACDEPERARSALAPMLAAAERVPWVAPLAEGCLVDGQGAALLGQVSEAHVLFARSAGLARRFGLTRVSTAAEHALVTTGR